MKKNFKLVLALILAAMMIVSMVSAMAAVENRTVDESISITGLVSGDKVYLSRVIKWTAGTGWELESAYSSLDNQTSYPNIYKILHPAKGDGAIQLTKAEVEAIAAIAKTQTITAETTTSTTYTKTMALADAGMYIALIDPVTPGTVYNPIIVSADFDRNNTNTIDSSETLGSDSTAVAKRQDITVIKTEPKITNDINDTYSFKIETTIPTYAASFQNTFFTLTDTMSDYLDLKANTLKVNGVAISACDTDEMKVVAVDGAQTFSITYKDKYIKALTGPQKITVTYDAKLNVTAQEAATLTNVHEENNEVTVEFPHNPKDTTGKDITALKDGTREYTFTIDGQLFGRSDWYTTEVIKVGLDRDGNPIESVVDYKNGSKHAALDGAEFKLYTTYEAARNGDDTKLYKNDVFTGTVTTDNDGRFFIPGLDAGTYYLKEISAPNGYIKDQDVHTITIEATLSDGAASDDGSKGDKITEWYTVNDTTGEITWYDHEVANSTKYEYYVPVLKSYKVTVDGNETTYNMTLNGPTISSVTINTSDTEIVNIKGVELPHTGGIGTTIFYVGGSLLVLAAAILLITKRRMSSND